MKKGFTLIEVMVVAVIVAILAAVAIPAYNGYVERAGNNVAMNVAGTIASGVQTWISEGNTVSTLAATAGPSSYTVGGNITVKFPQDITVTVTAASVTAIHSKGGSAQSVIF